MQGAGVGDEAGIDIAHAVPLLVGVVGSADDRAPESPQNAEAFEALLREFRQRYVHTPIVVLCAETASAEAAAVVAADELGIAVVSPRGDDPWTGVASPSDILVVISNGPLPADLAAFAERRRHGSPPGTERALLAPPNSGPCFVLAGGKLERSYPPRFAGDRSAATEFAAGLERRDRFNRDLRAVPVPAEGTTLDRMRARVSVVANALQDKTLVWQRVLYGLAFLAATAQIVSNGPIFTWVKFAAVAVAFVIFFLVRQQKYQSRYQDYRAISEALRVQAVWSAIGVDDRVEDSYMPMQQTDLQWIRNVLRCINALRPSEPAADAFHVVRAWVAHQHRYFSDHSHIEARRRENLSGGSDLLGGLSVVASLTILATILGRVKLPGPYVHWFEIFAAWAALCVAVARSYSHTRAYSENANRYQRMFLVFDQALSVVDGAGHDDARAREVATQLGRVALAEHAEWLLAQRERPISMVATSAA